MFCLRLDRLNLVQTSDVAVVQWASKGTLILQRLFSFKKDFKQKYLRHADPYPQFIYIQYLRREKTCPFGDWLLIKEKTIIYHISKTERCHGLLWLRNSSAVLLQESVTMATDHLKIRSFSSSWTAFLDVSTWGEEDRRLLTFLFIRLDCLVYVALLLAVNNTEWCLPRYFNENHGATVVHV